MIELTFLIPVTDNEGEAFTPAHFAEFEALLLSAFGGYSVAAGTTDGAWVDEGLIYTDRNRSYTVGLDSITAAKVVGHIADYAKVHFRQEAIYIRYLGLSEIL